ncbi:TonB-dependent receptor plug domain-containing protein [Aestuariivita boseongensis]|uniref:TonB-dependent receptor plug domain-containing protein n=1 Tax=Aestuariivita boseongensis TaxID=1470562 RepID=UPI0006823EF7|nr:TonB-dependent receptor [Aestuariivita boseongensis]
MTRYLASASALALILAAPAARAQQLTLDLGEISVTATAEPLEEGRTGTSVRILTAEDELSVPGDLQLTDALRRETGLSVLQNGPAGTSAELRIRGAQERYTAVYVDGIKVNDPASTSGQYGNFGTFGIGALAGAEVLKGSQSALYGGSAVAGVVNVFTLPDLDGPQGITQRANVMFGSFGTIAASYAYAHNAGAWSTAFALSYAEADGFSAGDENRGNTEDDGFRETRVSFGAAYQASDTLRLGFNGFYVTADTEFDEGTGAGPVDGTPGDETGTREEIGLRLFAEIDTGLWQHDFALSYFNVDRTLVSATVAPGSFSAFTSTFEGERQRFDWQSSGQINDQLRLTFGADWEKLTAKSTSLPGGSAETTNTGLFAEALYTPNNQLDINASVRFDDNSQFGNETTGRLAVSYRPTQELTLRGVLATGFRAPVASELFSAFPDPLYPFFGNPALAPETSESIEIGFDYRFAPDAVFSATVFRNEIDNLIQFAPCPVTVDFVFFSCDAGTFSSLANVPGTTTFEGVELEYEHTFSDMVAMRLAYTYIDAATASGALLPRVAEHELFLGVDVNWTDRFATQLSVTHQADRAPDTSPAQVLGDFTVVDLSFTYDVTDQAQAYLAIKNVFDEQYQQIAGYGTSDRAFYVGVRATF